MEKPEKRFDVRIPIANAVLLGLLAEESEITGIVESRLLVQYATLYAQQRKGIIPMTGLALSTSVDARKLNEEHVLDSQTIQPSLGSEDLDTLFGDPD